MYGLTQFDLIHAYAHAWRPDRRRSVLVVEDDPFMKPILRRILRSIDPTIRLHWAPTFREACQALETTQFSMVISDCLLPHGASGLTVWDLCRKNQPELPFLMISGLSKDSIAKLAGETGEELPAHLSKPLNFTACRARILDGLQ
jgi:DNA-binding NtrC family response regulator